MPLVACVGVTIDWAGLPTRLFRFKDGSLGIVYGDRRVSPECYGEDGWPVDPKTGARLQAADQ